MLQCLVTCPTCFEEFSVTSPGADELPCVLDYDCEVCCSPMFIAFDEEGEAYAMSHDDY